VNSGVIGGAVVAIAGERYAVSYLFLSVSKRKRDVFEELSSWDAVI
jgi:hypothetical protein